jgi:hypothetical protein
MRRNLVPAVILVLGLTLLSTGIAFAAGPGTWSPTGSMATARIAHTATLLPNGKVLAAGGMGEDQVNLSTAELYDPATGRWSPTGSMSTGAVYQTATLLANGKVLVTGGSLDTGGAFSRAEIYDPTTGAWTRARSMSAPRVFHTATLLPDGRVLIAGGSGASAELYDPVTNTWSPTGSMGIARSSHTAILLATGKVLVTGNFVGSEESALTSSELYDPDTGVWSPTGSMHIGRTNFAPAVLLSNGKVLIAGSRNFDGPTGSSELYDPVFGTWSVTGSMQRARNFQPLTLLANGSALTEGGNIFFDPSSMDSSELYGPATGTWSLSGKLNTPRVQHAATLLNNGSVLVVGGRGLPTGPVGLNLVANAEVYSPPSQTHLPTSCGLSASGKDAAGHAFIKVAARNIASGLRSIEVVQATNATVSMPKFPLGFRDPAVVTATKVDPAQPSVLKLAVTNRDGTTLTCDPVMATLVGQRHGISREVFSGLERAESQVLLKNEAPGLERVDLQVNGRHFRMDHLADGEERILDVASAMRPGDRNTIVVQARGPKGGSALLVISD